MAAPPEPLAAVVVSTSLGAAGVALSPRGIRHATLLHTSEAAAWNELRAHGAEGAEHPLAAEIVALLNGYAGGDAGALDRAPVDLPPASDFHRSVWLSLRDIPAGQTRSYGWLAAHVGRPGAARAIGRAVGLNPIPLWLACHRIVASDGSLHGYGGGLAMKRRLLEHEGALQPALL